ncbi:hypothetical protein HWV62_34181 [Athelia sp. TMB]|nr:hypothetical protein HWV62_34181 [Athelia sp. TMB]
MVAKTRTRTGIMKSRNVLAAAKVYGGEERNGDSDVDYDDPSQLAELTQVQIDLGLRVMQDASTSTSEMAAQQNNAKAFPLFAKKLKSDNLKDFSGYVKKLGTWLNVEKAYYAEGRPEIAQATVRRQIQNTGGDPAQPLSVASVPPEIVPWVEAYSSIVKVVVRFTGRFPEPDLLERLRVITAMGNIASASGSRTGRPAGPLAAPQVVHSLAQGNVLKGTPIPIPSMSITSSAKTIPAQPSSSPQPLQTPEAAHETAITTEAPPCTTVPRVSAPSEDFTQGLHLPLQTLAPSTAALQEQASVVSKLGAIADDKLTAKLAPFSPRQQSGESKSQARDSPHPAEQHMESAPVVVDGVELTSLDQPPSPNMLLPFLAQRKSISPQPIVRELSASDVARKLLPPIQTSPIEHIQEIESSKVSWTPAVPPQSVNDEVSVDTEPGVKSPVINAASTTPFPLSQELNTDTGTAAQSSSANAASATPTPPPISQLSTVLPTSAAPKGKKRRLAIPAHLIAADLALAKKKRQKVSLDVVEPATPSTPSLAVSAPLTVTEPSKAEISGDGDILMCASDDNSIPQKPEGLQQMPTEPSNIIEPVTHFPAKADDVHSLESPPPSHFAKTKTPDPAHDATQGTEASEVLERPRSQPIIIADEVFAGELTHDATSHSDITAGDAMNVDAATYLGSDVGNDTNPLPLMEPLVSSSAGAEETLGEIDNAIVSLPPSHLVSDMDISTLTLEEATLGTLMAVDSSLAVTNSGDIRHQTASPVAVSLPPDEESPQVIITNLDSLSPTPHIASRDKAADFWPQSSAHNRDSSAMDISRTHSPSEAVADETDSHTPVKEEDVMDFLGTIPLGASLPAHEADTVQHQLPTPPATGDPTEIAVGHEMAVIAAKRGSASPSTIAFKFELDTAQRLSLHLWQHRKSLAE